MKRSGEIRGPAVKRKKLDQNAFVGVSPSTINILQLNSDVLRKIFAYCTVPNLWTLARSNNQLKKLIVDNGIIGGRLFDFEELSKCCHILDVFKVFGKQITHIKIGETDVQYKEITESNLDEILRLISTYCAVDTLKYLYLQYCHNISFEIRYMYAALPFFRSLESFSLKETDEYGRDECALEDNRAYNYSINELVEQIITNAINLTSIQLTHLKVSERFFIADHLRQNLENLSIVNCNIRVPERFIKYLKYAPELVSFNWDESSLLGLDTVTKHSSDIVYDLLAKYVPDLEAFNYSQHFFFMTERNRWKYVSNFTYPNHQLLRNFGKLKILGLATMEIECLQLLAEMNQVEELNADLPIELEDDFDFLNSFSNLKSVKVTTDDFGAERLMNYLSMLPQFVDESAFWRCKKN